MAVAAPSTPFSACLNSACADAGRIRAALTLTVRDGNEFWFVLPDGVLPEAPDSENWSSFLHLDADARRACLLTRMAFEGQGRTMTDALTGMRFCWSSSPACWSAATAKAGAPSRALMRNG